MNKPLIFSFKTDISMINVPSEMNNPFGSTVPEIARIAAKEFQQFISTESLGWEYNFETKKGKMFGILVVQRENNSYGYLGTISGELARDEKCDKFVPSIFDDSTDDFFINKGMTELAEMGKAIKMAAKPTEINKLTEARKQKSFALQQRLFENYEFTTAEGNKKKVLQIFTDSAHGNPPAAAGECAAPKLLQYAFSHQLTPIAIAEFWWGNPSKNKEREPLGFYPACKNKCRPILEFMLEDDVLFEITNT